jgi:hypothetical protein
MATERRFDLESGCWSSVEVPDEVEAPAPVIKIGGFDDWTPERVQAKKKKKKAAKKKK